MDPLPIEPGSVWLLTTRGSGGVLRTRPVTLFRGPGATEVSLVTGDGARKVDEIRLDPHVTVAGPLAAGWWAGEGVAAVESDPLEVLQLAGLAQATPVVAIRIRLRVARRWIVHSPKPWDNSVTETRVDDSP